MPMTAGKVEAIYIAPQRGEPTVSVPEVHVVPGMGIVGDRYYLPRTSPTSGSKPGKELTLVAIEAIEDMQNQDGIRITPAETRRNIITRGVSLNDLVGRDFFIGEIKLRGVRLCNPCQYLADRTDPRVLSSMAQRGGLRAEVITEGNIHINDIIAVPD